MPVCGTKHFRHTQACYGFSSSATESRLALDDDAPIVLPEAAGNVYILLDAHQTFPSTEPEQEWMGEKRDRMMGQAREKVTEVKETIKEKVQDAAEQVQKAAEDVTNSL